VVTKYWNFLKEHPIWSKVIAGVIVAILVGSYSRITGSWPFSRDVPQLVEPETKVFLREKSASELKNHLASFPPLQRKSVGEKLYIGRWVQWDGKVVDVRAFSSEKRNYFSVYVIRDSEYVGTSLVFSQNWLEKVEKLREEDMISFEGKIYDVDGGGGVSLFNPSFVIQEQKK
jgi:hypothetical protein